MTEEEKQIIVRTLDKVIQKVRKKHSEIPVVSPDEHFRMTYYDGIRAGLAWVDGELCEYINTLQLDDRSKCPSCGEYDLVKHGLTAYNVECLNCGYHEDFTPEVQ